MLADAGEIVIPVTVFAAAVTVSVAVPVIPPDTAVTGVDPAATPVATPPVLMAAIAALPVAHAAVEVTLAVDPSL